MYHVFVPLILFGIIYKLSGLLAASGVACASATLLLALDYLLGRKINSMVAMATGISSFLFLSSFLTGSETLIKMKPTIVYSSFALVLIISTLFGHDPLKIALGDKINLSPEASSKLLRRWIALFLSIAVLNEWIWRTCPEPFWIGFKLVGILAINTIFLIAQLPTLMRGSNIATLAHRSPKNKGKPNHSDLSQY